MKPIVYGFLVLVTVAWRPPVAAAQTPPPQAAAAPQTPKAADPLPNMELIARALGVNCRYCHAAAADGNSTNFRSDENPKKPIARQMLAMTREINERIAAATGKAAAEVTRIDCVNCHRGVPVPGKLTDILAKTIVEKGHEAAIEQYRELRKRFYARDTYDFSENELLGFLQRVAESRPDAALAMLQMNLEFNPRSAQTYLVMSRAYTRKRDTAMAIESLKKVLEIEPENGVAKGYLYQMERR